MYLGKVVETGRTDELFTAPSHPYIHALLSGIPIPDIEHKTKRIILEGDVPSPVDPPPCCRFCTRCPFVLDICRQVDPQLKNVSDGHLAACHRTAEMVKLIAG